MTYPIKYAIEELKVPSSYDDITKGYIVSKCYIIESRFNYRDECTRHVLSFPYDDFYNFVCWYYRNRHNYNFDIFKHYYEQRRDPDRELLRDEYPMHIVSELFDTYEEAKDIADSKNGILKGNLLENTGSAAYKQQFKEFEEMMEICGEYEKFIFDNTSDMNITNDALVKKLRINNYR